MEITSTFGERIRNETFAERLRTCMRQTNMTQRTLAAKSNISEVSISSYLAGQRQPSSETLVSLAHVLNTSVDYLSGNSDDRNPPVLQTEKIAASPQKIFATQLNTCLMCAGMTQKDLSDKTGIEPSFISQYVNAYHVPNQKNLILIARALNTTTDYLLGNTNAFSTTDIQEVQKQEDQTQMSIFAKRFNERLRYAGMTQRQFSKKTGIGQPAISRYINTDRMPSSELLIRIADALGTSTDYLLGHTNSIQPIDDNPIRHVLYNKLNALPCDQLYQVEKFVDNLMTPNIIDNSA